MSKACKALGVWVFFLSILLLAWWSCWYSPVDKSQVITTRASLKTLHNAVLQFKMDTGRLPTVKEGLWALVSKPQEVENWDPGGYIESVDVPLDAWGCEFVYVLSPEAGVSFAIISYGADGKKGGKGFDKDILSTDVICRRKARGEESPI